MSPALPLGGPDRLFGVELVEPVGEGDEMTASMVLDERHLGPDGRPAAGGLGVLVDEVLGYSMIASLPPGSWTVSTEIWVDLVAPLPASGRLVGVARTVQTGSFAVGTLSDDRGRVVVECRERGRRIDDVPTLDGGSAKAVPAPEGALAQWLLRRSEGEAPAELEVSPGLENPRRMLHGGVSLAAAEVVATAARVRAGCDLPTTSLHVVHTRPAPYGSVVELSTTTVHGGRSLWVTDVVGAVAGKPVVLARVSAQ